MNLSKIFNELCVHTFFLFRVFKKNADLVLFYGYMVSDLNDYFIVTKRNELI